MKSWNIYFTTPFIFLVVIFLISSLLDAREYKHISTRNPNSSNTGKSFSNNANNPLSTTSPLNFTLQTPEGGFDREYYLPSLSDTNDFDRAWISVTDPSANTTNSQDLITITIRNEHLPPGLTSISFILKETGDNTSVFTTTGTAQPVMYPVGTTSGYVEDFNYGTYNYPALGSSVTGLNLKVFWEPTDGNVAPTDGNANTGSDGELVVASGDTLLLLYGGSTLDTAPVGFHGSNWDGTLGFNPSSVPSVTTDSLDTPNLEIKIIDPDENLNPVARDVIGFVDRSIAFANHGTGTSRVQIEAIDQITGSTLFVNGTDIVARNIMLVETGNNTGEFVASGKVFNPSFVSADDLKGNVLVGSSSLSAYGGETITLGDPENGPSATFRIIETNASGKIGLYYAGQTGPNVVPVLGFTVEDDFIDKGISTLGIAGVTSGISTTRVVIIGTTTCAFGNPGSIENQGTSPNGLLKLIEGDNYCLVAVNSFKGTATIPGTVGTTYEVGNGGSVAVSIDSFQLDLIQA